MFIKGFNKDLKCRGFQFEVGKEYKTGAKKLELCTDTVFHFCKSIQQVHGLYSVDTNNRFCEIEVLGDMVEDDKKCGANHIKIVREIVGDELNTLIGKINGNTGLFNSGSHNSGSHNSGHYNSGSHNSGSHNSGHYNSWHYNSGDCNSGSHNSGHYNSGHYNSGDCNSGHYNSCDFSSGIFCSKEPMATIFNQPTNMTMREFYNSKYWEALQSSEFPLTERINEKLISHTYQEACAIWWKNMTKENKEIVMSMPNFDKKVFKEITGIEVVK